MNVVRYVLWGDGDSPHLLKWARALSALPQLELWAASSRGFLPGFDACVPAERRLALATSPDAAGGNVALLKQLPRLAHWLKQVDATVLHAHYLSSHGTLAWLARRLFGVRAALVASAWGSDILVTPDRSRVMRWATQRVLRDATLATSDSRVMAQRMVDLGGTPPLVFPFGLDSLPPPPPAKAATTFFANRGLEPIYHPQRVLQTFQDLADPAAELVVANDGSLRVTLQAGAPANVHFVGRLDASTQATHYARAQWYLSLPHSDSVAVSVLEAMAHGCIPILSDLPANRELVCDGDNGIVLKAGERLSAARLAPLLARAPQIAAANRAWVAEHALFAPCVQRFVDHLLLLLPVQTRCPA